MSTERDPPVPAVHYLGVEFDGRGPDAIVAALADRAGDAPFAYVVTPNVDHLIRLHGDHRDPRLASAYAGAAMCLCDSRILARLAAWVGIKLPVTPGSDLTARILSEVVRPGDRLAVVGGDAEMLASLRTRFPDVAFVQHLPPMGLRTNAVALAEAARFVADARARFAFLAVGSPQQEYLASAISERGDAIGVGLCIGASIDFVTGRVQRAPRWMQRAGLEWAHRLASEPRRLWRRYLVDGPRIFGIAWRARQRG